VLNTNPNEYAFVTYSWCYQHDLFDKKELKKILDYANTIPKIEPAISQDNGMTIDKSFRNSEISWVSRNNASSWFFDKITKAIDSMNNTYYNFNLYGFSELQFTEYDSANLGKYDFHIDMILGNSSKTEPLTRKLSATILLNDEFEGGDFEFYGITEQPKMTAGSLIVFPSFMLHKITPVTKVVRNSLVTWCLGPKFS